MKTIFYIGLGAVAAVLFFAIAAVVSLSQTYIFLDNSR